MEPEAEPAACREIDLLVYLREHGEAACAGSTGYRAHIAVGTEGLDALTLHPLMGAGGDCEIRPGSALWRVTEAFLMVLPALRARAAMRPVREIA